MKEKVLNIFLYILFFLAMPVLAQESLPTDDIVVKAANAVVFQMTENLKLTQDQISAVEPIIAENIAQVRNLQQNLENGNIDGTAMYNQREQLNIKALQDLSLVLTPSQMKVWRAIQYQLGNIHSNLNIAK